MAYETFEEFLNATRYARKRPTLVAAWQAGRDSALARAERAEAALAAAQDELDDLMAQRDVAEAALAQCQHDLAAMIERKEYFRQCWGVAEAAEAALQMPCVWRVKAPAHFVGHMDDKPLEMILVATSCGKELGVAVPPPYCAYCGHPVEVLP